MGNVCPICKRELGESVSVHHLVPVLKGGKRGETIRIHRICHDKIHSLFTERELQVKYDSVEKLLADEDMIKFIKWVQNKPPDFKDPSKKMKKH